MIEISERITFLQKIRLFNGLVDDEFQLIAESSIETSMPEGAVIFEEGGKPESFYMIYHGKVSVTRKQNKKKKQLAILKKYDYFGDTDLVLNRWRSATTTALTDTSLLVISRREFQQLYQEISKLKRRRLKRLIFFIIPQTIGQFVLDILGRDKASATTALILGWLIFTGLVLLAMDILTPNLIISSWNSFFPSTP